MKFDPLFFIRMAEKNGITLTKIDGNIRVKNASQVLSVIKQHKRQLIKHLREDPEKRLQLDLFDDF